MPTAVECGGTCRPTSANIRRVCGDGTWATYTTSSPSSTARFAVSPDASTSSARKGRALRASDSLGGVAEAQRGGADGVLPRPVVPDVAALLQALQQPVRGALRQAGALGELTDPDGSAGRASASSRVEGAVDRLHRPRGGAPPSWRLR